MSTLTVGTILKGRYRIINILFQTRLTNVYTAEDLHLRGKIWAIREIIVAAPDYAEQVRLITHFQAEALKLSAIHHPHYGKMVDFFSLESRLYIIREYIPGIDLITVLKRSEIPFPQDKVLYWGIQLADVLHYLFLKKFPLSFFREFKPESIILASNGVVKLIDLGLQNFYLEDHSQFLNLKFTPTDYSPPEHFEEEPVFDERSLVYMLGVLMYFLVTKNHPSENLFNFPDPETLNPKISPLMSELLKKAYKKDMKDRYPNLPAFKAKMQEALKASGSSLKRWVAQSKSKPPGKLARWLEVLMVMVLGIIIYVLFKLLFNH
jgi:serine/threonine protein kinase